MIALIPLLLPVRNLLAKINRVVGEWNRVVDEWNGLPNHIRESNGIATFKRNVLSFIRDN